MQDKINRNEEEQEEMQHSRDQLILLATEGEADYGEDASGLTTTKKQVPDE